MYNWCQNRVGPALGNSEVVWNNFAPPEAKFISWLAWRGRLKTSDFLSRIGVLRGSRNLCCVLCKAEEETCNHLLLSCNFVWRVWSNIMAWWEIQWVSPGSFEGLMYWWLGWRLKKKVKEVWWVVFISVVGSLWMYRNDCVFNNVNPDADALSELIKIRVAMWFKIYDSGCCFSIQEIVSNIKWVRHMS